MNLWSPKMMADCDRYRRCCFKFIITMGFTALFLWLSLRIDELKCYITSFYVPALNKSLSSPSNSTIFFAADFDNGNKDKGIRYDAVDFTFSIFVDRNRTRPIGNATIDGFYQGHKKSANKQGSFAADGVNRTLINGKVYYRVNFTTTVKFKIMVWFTKRHSLWGGANVEVDDSGEKTCHKGIRLGAVPPKIESGAPQLGGCYCALLGFFVSILRFSF